MLKIEIEGRPQPGGSKSAFHIAKINRTVVTDSNKKAKPWKVEVAKQAMRQVKAPLEGAISVTVYFNLKRPAFHFNSKGFVKESAPTRPIVKPDATKLWRPVEDALTGILWKDDAQVCAQLVIKQYGLDGKEGCTIYAEEI